VGGYRRDDGLRRSVPLRSRQRYIDWDLPDPAGRPIDKVRSTRDEINRRVHDLIAELDGALVWRSLRVLPFKTSLEVGEVGP
jgi:hypothetical protein